METELQHTTNVHSEQVAPPDAKHLLCDVCQECGGTTENDGAACKGACTSERYYGNDMVDLDTKGLPSCNCCEDCRWKCHDSFMQSVEDGEQ